MIEESPKTRKNEYFRISPLMLFPETLGKFRVYLKQAGGYVLYSEAEERFTHKHRTTLYESGVSEVYVLTDQKDRFQSYLEENLGEVITDTTIEMEERSKIFYNASVSMVKDVFEERLPKGLEEQDFKRVADLVKQSIMFLSQPNSLKTIGSLISYDYHIYSHSVHVFVYTLSTLNSYEGINDKALFKIGLGTMLHDIGKSRISKAILNKRGRLTQHEREIINQHPILGVSKCSNMPLEQETINCILFHHERFDGFGYPSGMKGTDIPLPVRIMSIADVYDAITSDRAYAKGMRPFEALQYMRDQMRGAFDVEVFKRFIMVLSGAGLT